jgi:putative glutamine amidotransferase
MALCEAARRRRLPTLAICRGAQIVNVALGGSLVQDIPDEVPDSLVHAPDNARRTRTHTVHVSPESRLAGALGESTLTTNSSHHQSVDRVAPGLCVSARSDDGIVEGLESADPDWWMVAVQWHPEELTETSEAWDRNLFAAFAERVKGS